MCKIAICDDDKEYREKIKTVIETEGILNCPLCQGHFELV